MRHRVGDHATAASPPGDPSALPDEVGARVEDHESFLHGAWELHRELRDLDGRLLGRFRGEGRWRPAGDGWLRYDEDGTLQRDGTALQARRALRYQVAPTPVAVTFDDGRAFHDLDLRSGAWQAVHPCGPDTYAGSFTVLAHDRWVQRWTVTGSERYVSTTWLRRLGAAPEG